MILDALGGAGTSAIALLENLPVSVSILIGVAVTAGLIRGGLWWEDRKAEREAEKRSKVTDAQEGIDEFKHKPPKISARYSGGPKYVTGRTGPRQKKHHYATVRKLGACAVFFADLVVLEPGELQKPPGPRYLLYYTGIKVAARKQR